MTYQEAIGYLYQLQRYGIRPSLEVIGGLMEILDQPHQKLRSVHIGGTNGKGSTAAMLASVLQASGYKVGLYTSPHLIDFTERMRVNGAPIPPESVADLTDHIHQRLGPSLSPTFFEFTTAMAFLYFARQRVDVAVMEVGMGGRFDATNVLQPLVSVITNVDYDHEVFLGDTLSKIAAEKAGIIKPHTPVVSAASCPEAIQVIEEACIQKRSRLLLLEDKASDGLSPRERQVQASGFAGAWPGHGGIASGVSRPPYSNTWGHRRGEARTGPHIETVWVDGRSPADFDYHGQKMTLRHLASPLLGHHQIINAGTMLATVELLSGMEIRLSEESIREGLRSVRWDGRLEVVKREPLVLLDGAHNPAGAKVLGNFLAEMKQVRKGRLLLLVGILADKNIGGILKEIAPFSDEVILTRPDYSGAASLEDLRKGLGDYTMPITPQETIPEAVAYALGRLLPQDILCITGSLYTVGAAKAFLEGREKPPVFRG